MRFSASERSSLISLLPVPLNSSKITSSILEPVSTSAVAMIVSEPPPDVDATERAEPKKALGFAIACASRPPDIVRPVPRSAVLCARAMRVSESSTMMTSFPISTSRRARSGVVARAALRAPVQEGRLARARGRHDARALAIADRRDQVDRAPRQLVSPLGRPAGLEEELSLRIRRDGGVQLRTARRLGRR